MSRITRREFLRLSGAAAATAIVAACGKATTPPPVAATKPPEAPKVTEAPKGPERSTTWPISQPPRGRTLVYYWSSAPAAGRFNPYPGVDHQNGTAICYEPAAFYAAHADKTYMWLAESYKYNANATELTITFRKGIKWSDGTAFTANDVKWTMDTLMRVKGLYYGSFFQQEVKSVDVVDDTNIKLTLNQTDWRFFFKVLTYRFDRGADTVFVPPQVFKNVPDEGLISVIFWDKDKKWPISTGAYGVSESTEQSTYYDLRPTWWAVETGFVPKYPDVWRLQMSLFTNDTTAAQMLINKEIDQSLDLRPLVCASALNQADHLTTWTGKKPPYGYLDWWPISVWFQTVKPPFDNPDVRWAHAYAIDQQKVVDIAWAGAGKVAYAPFPEYPKLNEYIAGIKDLTDQYNVLEYNLDKSAALMTKAGFTKNKDGFWADKDGVVPDSNLYAGVPLFGDIAPVVAEQLRSAGFACEHKAPPDVWTAKGDGRANLHLFGHGGSVGDPYDTFYLYASEVKPLGVDCGDNRARWKNDEFIKITAEMANTAMDDPKMKDLFKAGMTILLKELPDCPLVQWFHRIPVNTWYWSNWPDETNPYMNSALWHQTMLQVVLGLKATDKA